MHYPSRLEWQARAADLQLKPKSGELVGPCPACGGTDRFRVTRSGGFFCRQCCPDGRDTRAIQRVLQAAGWGHAKAFEKPRLRGSVADLKAAAKRLAERRQAAATRAQEIIDAAAIEPHPYLEAKGFPRRMGLVHDGDLIVPVRSAQIQIVNSPVMSVQRIAPDGSKRFLPGGKVRDGVFRIGHSGEQWWTEGYATALSVVEALGELSRTASVIVCFSAANMARVAKQGFVVADNDSHGVGQKYARKTGLPWWMPPEAGMDANDYHRRHGVAALAREIRNLIARPVMT